MIGSFALKPCGEELKTHHPGLAGFVQRKPRLALHPVVCRVLRRAKPACGRGGSCLVSKSTRAAAHPRVTHEGAQRCLLTSPATEGGPAPLALRRTPSGKRALPSLHVPERDTGLSSSLALLPHGNLVLAFLGPKFCSIHLKRNARKAKKGGVCEES